MHGTFNFKYIICDLGELRSLLILSLVADRYVGGYYPFSFVSGMENGYTLFCKKSVYLHDISGWRTFAPKRSSGYMTLFCFCQQKALGHS